MGDYQALLNGWDTDFGHFILSFQTNQRIEKNCFEKMPPIFQFAYVTTIATHTHTTPYPPHPPERSV